MNNTNNLRYFIYARKSLEDEGRQIQSIEDQVDYLIENLVKKNNLNVIKIFTESKSAKKPYKRPVFDEMIERLNNGEADGIICWQLNRLSRNPVDSGNLGWMLQNGIIKEIRTPGRTFLSEDNVLLFAVESGTANQFILDLRKNTQRGLDGKLKRGWLPGKAPQGYLNHLKEDGEHIVIKDPKRFLLVRKMWDMLLTGQYSVDKILKIVNNEWGYRTKKAPKLGDTMLAKSTLYRVFHNPFYYGVISYRGKLYQGNHEPMITYEEFKQAQKILNKIEKPQPKTREFAYTGLIKCGHCGCSITAEEKHKFNKTAKEWCVYTYYRCTKKKLDVTCSEGRLTLKQIEDQISNILGQYEIDDKFTEWAIKILEREHQTEVNVRNQRHEMLNKTYEKTRKEIDNLTQLRIKDMIDDEQFTKEKNRLDNEIINFKQQLNENCDFGREWIDKIDTALSFVGLAKEVFNKTNELSLKREILSTLGVNFTIKDGKLSIDYVSWLSPVQTLQKNSDSKDFRFELRNFVLNKTKNEANCLALPILGG